MRKSKVLASLLGAGAMVVWGRMGKADTSLWSTEADFGGSSYAPNPGTPQQTGDVGWGNYVPNRGTMIPTDYFGNPLSFSPTPLGANSPTVNGLGNLDNKGLNSLNPPNTDANYGTSWEGLPGNSGTPSGGSMILDDYQGVSEATRDGVNMGGGYDPISTGELITVPTGTGTISAGSQLLLNTLAASHAIAIDFTAPGGGTVLTSDGYNSSPYYILEFGINNTQYNGSEFVTGWANPSTSPGSRDLGNYNDDPGAFCVNHGTYFTAYIPYDYTEINNTANTYMQLDVILNSDGFTGGAVTMSNIRTISPTWAAAGNGSWNDTGVITGATTNSTSDAVTGGTLTNPTATDWIGGGINGLGAPDGSGQSATFGDIETGNATVTLDSSQTLGTLDFNTLNYQYTLAVGVAGALVMDNTANSASAQINDIAGGTASTNYTEFLAVPITLNSNTVITVSRATDTLQIGNEQPGGTTTFAGNIVSGTGNITVAGSGTLVLDGPNAYGSTTVNAGATLIAASDGALPNSQALINNGNTTVAGNETLSSLTGTGKLTVGNGSENNIVKLAVGSGQATQGGLTIAPNSSLDITNNHMIISYGATDPMATIVHYLKTGFNNGGWNGPGIISSQIAIANANSNNPQYGIGFSDGNDKINGHSIVSGLSSGQIELKYTLLGDANLDGTVNGADFSILAANFGQGYTNWDQGNFLFTPTINGADFSAMAHNFGLGDSGADSSVSGADVAALDAFAAANGIAMPSFAVVPEPASMGLLAGLAIGALSRRRRK
jgi:fibronectin-binding autotransporter adhesin